MVGELRNMYIRVGTEDQADMSDYSSFVASVAELLLRIQLKPEHQEWCTTLKI